ncbi:hypothetical protein LXL04_032968 [Taraxacum kok-saghyz]
MEGVDAVELARREAMEVVSVKEMDAEVMQVSEKEDEEVHVAVQRRNKRQNEEVSVPVVVDWNSSRKPLSTSPPSSIGAPFGWSSAVELDPIGTVYLLDNIFHSTKPKRRVFLSFSHKLVNFDVHVVVQKTQRSEEESRFTKTKVVKKVRPFVFHFIQTLSEIVEEKKEQKIDVDNNSKKDGKSMKKEHALTDFVKNSLVQGTAVSVITILIISTCGVHVAWKSLTIKSLTYTSAI